MRHFLSRLLERGIWDIVSAYLKGGATPEKREQGWVGQVVITREPVRGALLLNGVRWDRCPKKWNRRARNWEDTNPAGPGYGKQ